MANEINEDILFDFDENAAIEDDDADSVVNGENRTLERRMDIQEINIKPKFTKKRQFINFCFNEIIFLTFIPSLIYNVFWIITLKYKKFENPVNFNFDELRNDISNMCYIVLSIGIFFLFIPQIVFVTNNKNEDYSFLFVFIKMILTYKCSNSIITEINEKLLINNNLDENNEISHYIYLYYKLEYTYIIGLYIIISIILMKILIRIVKEILKAIRYVL